MEGLNILLCLLLIAFQAKTTAAWWTTDYWTDSTDHTSTLSCMHNCGYSFGSCSCDYDCQYYGNCCPDYDSYCFTATAEFTSVTDFPSCMYNCGNHLGSCSCDYNCDYYGNCCPDYTNYCPAPTTVAYTAEPCGGYMTDWMGELFSPQYPSTYPNNARCTWTIHSTGNTTVSLTFTDVALETCCDYIRVYDGPSTLYPLLEDIRVFRNQSFKSSSNDLTVLFFSDHSVTHKGFHAEWISVEPCDGYMTDWNDVGSINNTYTTVATETISSVPHPECGGHLYGSGLFSSPNYPYYYHDSEYCVWYLSAQQGQRIFLTFADVQLERCCNCDYITVYDGSSTGYPQLGKVCFNDTTHQVFHSSSRYMTVVFRSDYSDVSHGFKALFTSSLTEDQGHVDCSSDNMVITIQRSYLNSLGLSANDLYVDDHVCRPTISSTEVVFNFPLDSCGTVKEMMNGYVSYTNNVRASQSQSGEITRQSEFLLHVGCRMEPDTMVQIFYKAREVTNANITGTGRFNASIAFYTSSSFYYQIYDSPYVVNLNQPLYVQVELNRHDYSLDLFLDTCVASPNPNDFKDHSYDLLRNGCAIDNTYYSYTNGHQYYARFSFRAFKFLRTHAFVYLQCKVIICPENDYNSRCRQGCRYRRKRSLDSSTYHTNTVTLGPIKLKGLRHGAKDLEKSKE
ncbi:hypothetical protein Q8A67_019657 [Cirrhinus molitorella]|uniref:Deleted in malignant brain tumors 1 protein n=1 Tax=Cirrhinus molitorella TaxID=172907 RepID=A0AA88PM10_9TELE|nr:hypothetical protein Q8A67_019657 [Cirrhinus molitorella]